MPEQPVAAIEGEVLPPPDPLAVPDIVIDDLTAIASQAAKIADAFSSTVTMADADAAYDAALALRAKETAVERLQRTLGTRAQSVKALARRSALIALVKAGHSSRKIGEMLGLKPNAVRVAIWRARNDGHLNDLREMLNNEVSALAIDTVKHHIKKKNADVAIEHLKGVGLYKNHSNVKNEGGGAGFQMPPLQVNVVVQNQAGAMPVTPENFDVSEGAIGVMREDA